MWKISRRFTTLLFPMYNSTKLEAFVRPLNDDILKKSWTNQKSRSSILTDKSPKLWTNKESIPSLKTKIFENVVFVISANATLQTK